MPTQSAVTQWGMSRRLTAPKLSRRLSRRLAELSGLSDRHMDAKPDTDDGLANAPDRSIERRPNSPERQDVSCVVDVPHENDLPLYSGVMTGHWLRYLHGVARDTWSYHAFLSAMMSF
ncbi:hypothetical protein N7461_002581 [Penicillium sp. DV-2018c]|nr:hypothetical protein N7461_002581 [Penicillium sp. DV-2018c]